VTLATPLAPDGHRGITCPECGRWDTSVRDSRPIANAIRRRRYCEGCGTRFTTHEIPQGEEAATEVNRRIAMLARRLEALPQQDRLAVLHVIQAMEDRTAAVGEPTSRIAVTGEPDGLPASA
jgi:hypothetical protein